MSSSEIADREDQLANARSLRIIGVHLAGAGTHKSAVMRGTVMLSRILSGAAPGIEHELFASAIAHSFPELPVIPLTAAQEQQGGTSPLFLEAFANTIGPTAHTDSDTRLLDVIQDLGGADIFCIDAPLSLPPCETCTIPCPGIRMCDVPAVLKMIEEWEARKDTDKRTRYPQPYMDRLFEVYARRHFTHPSLPGSFEFEAVLGSGRAPLSARATYIARRLSALFPKALIIETNATISALGWALASGFRPRSFSSLRNVLDQPSNRKLVMKRLESRKMATRGPGMHEQLFLDIAESPETFTAAMVALSAWGLLNGEIFLTKEFMSQDPAHPFKGWACLPKEILDYEWTQ